jgi:hypothetical protein
MLAFLISPIGRIVAWGAGILTIISAALIWYNVQIYEAKKEALASFNQSQLQEVVKEQKQFIETQKNLQDKIDDLEAKNQLLNDAVKSASDKADQAIDASNDKQVDPLFNQTLKLLRNTQKGSK